MHEMPLCATVEVTVVELHIRVAILDFSFLHQSLPSGFSSLLSSQCEQLIAAKRTFVARLRDAVDQIDYAAAAKDMFATLQAYAAVLFVVEMILTDWASGSGRANEAFADDQVRVVHTIATYLFEAGVEKFVLVVRW